MSKFTIGNRIYQVLVIVIVILLIIDLILAGMTLSVWLQG